MSLKTLFPSGDAEYFDKSKFDGSKNLSFVFGLDEVGVGCLAGPVVASCFAYPCDFSFHNIVPPVVIADSKKLDENRRARASPHLPQLEQAAEYNGGDAQQKREARRRFAIEAEH